MGDTEQLDLNIYFCGSIRGGRDDAPLYLKIVNHLKEKYGKVLTEHVANPEIGKIESSLTKKEIYDMDMAWLDIADVLVAEVTQVSMGVGFELGRASALGKPILALFRPSSGKNLTAMVGGAHNGTSFTVEEYEEADVIKVIDKYFANFKKQ